MATEIKGKKAVENDQKDPVCGMPVSSAKAFKGTLEGNDYYFCSRSCKEKFEADPTAYTDMDEPDID